MHVINRALAQMWLGFDEDCGHVWPEGLSARDRLGCNGFAWIWNFRKTNRHLCSLKEG